MQTMNVIGIYVLAFTEIMGGLLAVVAKRDAYSHFLSGIARPSIIMKDRRKSGV